MKIAVLLQILEASIPKRWYRMVLVKLKPHTRHLWLCPQPCLDRVNEIAHQQILEIPEGLPKAMLSAIPNPNLNATKTESEEETEVNASSKLPSTDYLVITIAAEHSRVAIRSEGEATSFFNLLAALGGIFGLFLGLSGVTMFEVIESYYILLSQGFGTFRHAYKVGVQFGHKMLQREKSPEFDDDDDEEEYEKKLSQPEKLP